MSAEREGTLNLLGLGINTDSELVQLTREGDSDAFGQLVLRYRNQIFRLALRLTDAEEDAEDVAQEAFIKAFNSISSFKGESRFSTWLYRITVNLALMKKRAKKSIFEYIDEPIETKRGAIRREFADTSFDPLRTLIAKESKEILEEAISKLGPADKAVFLLRHVDGLTTTEASRALNLSVPALKSRLHRSRLAVRESLSRLVHKETLLAPA
jgi:RNA polymerase sigma-70 factor (ECF subfamily)